MNRTVLAGRALAASLAMVVSLTACSREVSGSGGYTIAPGGSGEVKIGSSMLTLNIRSLQCGPAARAEISEKVDYNRERLGDAPSDWEGAAPPGTQWCVLTLEVTNTGGEPVAWSARDAPVTLYVGKTRYEAVGPAGELTEDFIQWARAEGLPNATFGINPGESGPDFTVFAIPEDARPTAIQVGDQLVFELA